MRPHPCRVVPTCLKPPADVVGPISAIRDTLSVRHPISPVPGAMRRRHRAGPGGSPSTWKHVCRCSPAKPGTAPRVCAHPAFNRPLEGQRGSERPASDLRGLRVPARRRLLDRADRADRTDRARARRRPFHHLQTPVTGPRPAAISASARCGASTSSGSTRTTRPTPGRSPRRCRTSTPSPRAGRRTEALRYARLVRRRGGSPLRAITDRAAAKLRRRIPLGGDTVARV
jgi:hypothetical protein